MALVSLIVPAYNARTFLPGFFSGLRDQAGNLELVFADDGSTDGTADLAEALAADLPFPARVLRLPHRGVSAARNAGINIANGEYFTFPDVDDEFLPDYGAALTEYAAAPGFDALILRHERRRADGKVLRPAPAPGEPFPVTPEDAARRLAENPTDFGAYDLLLRREFAEKTALSFPEDMAYYEDYAFFFRLYAASPRLLFSGRVLYRYCARPGSAVNRSGGERAGLLPRIRQEAARISGECAEQISARITWSLLWQASLWEKSPAGAVQFGRRIGAKAAMKRLSRHPDKRVRLSAGLGRISLPAFVLAARAAGRRHTHLRPGAPH